MSDFNAKMHQIRFRLGLRPRPRSRSLQRSPRPPSWISGRLLLREETGGKRGREKGGRRWEEMGEEREEAFLVMWPRRLSALNPPLPVPICRRVRVYCGPLKCHILSFKTVVG